MNNQTDTLLHRHIEKLIKAVQNIISNSNKNSLVSFQLEPVKVIEVTGFQYTQQGPIYTGENHTTTYKKIWVRAIFPIAEIVNETNEFKSTELFIAKNYNNPNAKPWFTQFVFHLINSILENQGSPNRKAVNEHKKKFVNDIKLAPHSCYATVYINGLILESLEIKIKKGVRLRQSNKEDIEAQSKFLNVFSYVPPPTAVLEIMMPLKRNDHSALQQMIEKQIVLLRLFDNGSVYHNRYDLRFDSTVSPFAQMGTPHNITNTWRQYYLTKSDQQRLVKFINNFPLPKDLYCFEKKADYITTAFDRYTESLLERVTIERRVANAVMAIEALFSNSGVELSFKMQIRTSKLLSVFGFEPLQVRKHMKEAYDIRSTFAHGGFLDLKAINNLEKGFGKIDEFVASIVNYVRILIIISIASGLGKNELLILIDDALIDKKRANELNNKMKKVQRFVVSRG